MLDEYLHENLLIISNLYNELKKDNNINDKKSKNRRHLIFLNNNNNNDTDYTNTKFYKFIKNIPKEYYSSFKYLLNELEYNDINLNNGLKYKKFHCGNQKGIYEIRALGIRIFFTILPNKDIYVITGILKKHFNKYLENNYIYLLSSLAYDSYDDISNNLNDNNYIENNKNVYDDIINYIDNKGRKNYNLL